MSYPVPVISTADSKTVTNSSTTFDTSMGTNEFYVFEANTNCYINQHASAPTATNGDGSMYVHAGQGVLIDGQLGAKLAVIRDTADGRASLTRVAFVK